MPAPHVARFGANLALPVRATSDRGGRAIQTSIATRAAGLGAAPAKDKEGA